MARTAMMTLRIDPELLAALKQQAADDGRSLSAQVLHLIRAKADAEIVVHRKRRRTRGMYAEFEAPDFAELREGRLRISKRLQKTLRAKSPAR